MSELHSLIETLGVEVTLKLVEEYGGTRRAVPKYMPAKHELKDLLGEAGFALLFQYFGGDEIKVPLAKRWRVGIYKERKMTPKEIARKTGYTEAAVYRILNGETRASGQLMLAFDGPDR